MSLVVLSMLFIFSFFFISTPLSFAVDTISQGQSLSGEQTLVSRGGNFELGFFTPGKSHNYYLGIWYKKVPKRTVVWVANREKPVSNASSSQLMISEDGGLVLLTHSKVQVWSSNSSFSASNSSSAVLFDDGNFMLMDGMSSHVLWQSFDHPTNFWLPGAKIGYNKFSGEHQFLTSWSNSEDPSPGLFSQEMDPHGISQSYSLWNRSKYYWTTGLWDGHEFSSIPEMRVDYYFTFTHVSNVNVNYFIYALNDQSVIRSFMLDYNGQMKHWQWENKTQDWVLFASMPRDPCDVYSVCGPFGSCDNSSFPSCRCLQGFEPLSKEKWNLGDCTGGCGRRTPLPCVHNNSHNGKGDGFILMTDLEVPTNFENVSVTSAKECESACLKNCSCTGYSYDGRCITWSGDLLDLKKGGSSSIYLRLAASELPKSRITSKKHWMITVALAALVAAFAIIGAVWVSILILKRLRAVLQSEEIQGFLVSFQYKVLQKATKNFSERLGSGGFGSVFKGVLPDLTTIAVKKLEGVMQGEKQFRMEVRTIGMVQHVNLVCLRGFCSQGDKKLLVYEFVPKGSLDSYLFREDSKILEWKQRYQIMLGIARGLAYLHEKCRECIIHCDIKPENILLDSDFCPKVADFGMAKLVGHEFSRVLTTMRGTFGYLAPEWLSGSPITPKADVYSFGMMLFEIISGRRNTEASDNQAYFPVFAAIKLQEGDVLCLMDQRLDGKANLGELDRACRVACWCIQDHETHRPTMGQVVQVLEEVIGVDLPPIPRMLQRFANSDYMSCIGVDFPPIPRKLQRFANSDYMSCITSESISSESTKYLSSCSGHEASSIPFSTDED